MDSGLKNINFQLLLLYRLEKQHYTLQKDINIYLLVDLMAENC